MPHHRGRVIDVEQRELVLQRHLHRPVHVGRGDRRNFIAFPARIEERLDRAGNLQAVRREHRVDVVPVFRDHGLHHLLAFYGTPVRIDRIENLDAGISPEHLHRRFHPVLVRARTRLTAQDDDISLAVQLLDNPLREQPPHHRIRCGDEGHEIIGVDAAVDHDNGNTALGCLTDRGIERLRRIGAHDQQVDAARHQILDIGNLLGIVMAGVRDQELLDDVGMVMRRLFQRMQADHAPAVAEARIGEPDCIGRCLLEFRRVANADIERGVEQECPRRTRILGLSGCRNDRRNCSDRQIGQPGTKSLHHYPPK